MLGGWRVCVGWVEGACWVGGGCVLGGWRVRVGWVEGACWVGGGRNVVCHPCRPATVRLVTTVNLAYNVPVGTSVFCPLYTKSVLRVYCTLSVIRIYRTLSVIDINCTLSVIRIYRTLSVIDINRTLSGICISYTVRYTHKCDTVRYTTASLHHGYNLGYYVFKSMYFTL